MYFTCPTEYAYTVYEHGPTMVKYKSTTLRSRVLHTVAGCVVSSVYSTDESRNEAKGWKKNIQLSTSSKSRPQPHCMVPPPGEFNSTIQRQCRSIPTVSWLLINRFVYAARCYAYAVMRCPSVRLSRSCILSKRVNKSSKCFHHRVATPFWFFRTKRYGNIPTGTILAGASMQMG